MQVIHKNSSTPGAVPTGLAQGELAVNAADRLGYIANLTGTSVKVFDQYNETEADDRYVQTGILPITRIGDTPYLPLDIKGDFKGSVVPTRGTYMLREPDGSLVGLRPGYNGSISGAFYFYSSTGRISVEADFIYTDTPYAPNFLRNDGSVVEYVAAVNNSNQFGMLAEIRSTLNNSYRRWYWIHTNGTLDPVFHSYVDVTDTVVSGNLLSLQYSKEFNGFFASKYSGSGVVFFQNNLPTNYVNVPSPASTTLTPKNVNVVDPLTSATTSASVFADYTEATISSIFTPINAPGFTYVGPMYFNNGSYNRYPVVHQLMDDGITLSMFKLISVYSVYSNGGQYAAIVMRMRLNLSTNTITWYQEGNNATNQNLPLVFNPATVAADNTTSTGDPTSNAYKENKYPLFQSYVPDGSIWHAGTVDSYNFVDNHTVCCVGNVYAFYEFGITVLDTTTSTAANKLTAFTNRPYPFKGSATYDQTKLNQLVFVPYDASILGKKLMNATFLSRYRLGVNTLSRQYGFNLANRQVLVTYPTIAVNRTLDNAGSPNALPIPSNSQLVTNVTGMSAVPELVQYYNTCNTYIFSNGDYRVMPYGSESSVAYEGSHNLNSQVVKVIDGSNFTYDATRGGSTGVAIFPPDTTTKVPLILATLASTSTVAFASPSTTVKKYAMHYIGDYSTFAICLIQYTIQEVGTKTEMGVVTLRLPKTGIQMSFSADPNTNVVSTGKYTDAVTTTGYINNVDDNHACIGVLQYTDGRWFVEARGVARGYPGTVNVPFSTLEIAADGTIGRKLIRYTENNTGFGPNAAVHPDIGHLTYYSRYDYSQARISYDSWPSATAGAVAKTFATFDGKLNATIAPVTNYLLTVESAQGFFLYVTQFGAFLNGRQYQVPTMTLDLTLVVADPSSKTFYLYLHAISDTVMNLEILTAMTPETYDRVYMGFCTTNTNGIATTTMYKTTRLDLYRPSHDPYVGSAMPIPV